MINDSTPVYFGCFDTDLGTVMIGLYKNALAFVGFTNDPNEMRQHFKDAPFIENEVFCKPYVTRLWEDPLSLALHAPGTPLQEMVWQALQDIPLGETVSYQDIANAIGNPAAVRAVASAIGQNPISLVIPCHRVIRSDKSLGGYHWGLEKKQEILDFEKNHATTKSLARAA